MGRSSARAPRSWPRPADEAHAKIAILPWGDVFTDWLEPLGVSLKAFRDEFTGSWMFGYVGALRTAGIQALIVCITRSVDRPTRWTHRPTGATLHLLPPSRAFRAVQGLLLDDPLDGRRDARALGQAALTHVAPYIATPFLQLGRLLRAERCVALLCQEYETPRFDVCVALGGVLGIPAFATFQGGDYQLSLLERPIRPVTIRRAAGLIVATQTERERVRRRYGTPERNLARIFNPIDLGRWHPGDREEARAMLGIAPDAGVVVWHGQVQPRKGLDVLLEAWGRLCAERSGRALELLLVGTGQGAAELRGIVEQRRLVGVRIVDEWVLQPESLRRFLWSADVYAFPSRHEGFPVAPVEAMACGLPIVATDAEGVPDILEGGEAHGGIVLRRDDVDAFAEALGGLLDDPVRRHELGRLARRRAEAVFSLESVGKQLRALLVERSTT
jgi:starch synthase